MSVLRWIVGGLVAVVAVVVVGLVLVATAARFGDGPFGVLPGGPLVAGSMVHAPTSDWSFAADVREVELQLMAPPRSRTTWILVEDGRAFIPCGIPGFRLWKQWPHQALLDGRALVRIQGRRYPVQLIRREDPDLKRRLGENANRKYESSAGVELEVWYFELSPPEGSRGA